jgi:pullulanase
VRNPGRLLFTLLLPAALVACGDEEDPTPADSGNPTPDSGVVIDAGPEDTGPSDSGVAAFLLHYHRADGDYTGWTVELAGDVSATSASQVAPDGFGAVFEIPLSPGASSFTYRFVNGATPDPAVALSVDVTAAAAEQAWHFSGYEQPILVAPPAIPGPDQVAIYYLRSDTEYDGWGLHLWGDVVLETAWQAPAMASGVDPRFGAYWTVDLDPGAARVNVIVHMGDTKDPGPDMGWDLSALGNIVFLKTRSTDISPFPVSIPAFTIEGAKAHFLTRDTLAWNFNDTPATRFELRSSATAEIKVEGTEVTGGTVTPLTLDNAGLPNGVRNTWPHLATLKALKLAGTSSTVAMELLRGQLVVVARDDEDKALAATFVQIPGALDDLYRYEGPLGVSLAGRVPTIRVWAPTAQEVRLLRYDANLANLPAVTMTRSTEGVWAATGEASWYGTYYRYQVRVYHPITNRVETVEVTDPYSVSVSTDGAHTHIIDLDDPALVPAGWDTLTKPNLEAPEDITIYELHVRDFSANDNTVPVAHRGKFLAFTYNGEGGATLSDGMAHLSTLADAGLNTIQFLPSFDYATVPEDADDRVELSDGFDRLCAKNPAVPAATCAMYGTMPIATVLAAQDPLTGAAQVIGGYVRSVDAFNWGYDPQHYSVPEGGYATDPNGGARILELRRAVQALSQVGLRISLDVVYNHTNSSGIGEKSVLDKIVPGYYHRLNVDTGFVEQSTCCANTATEHFMMERLMIDSLVLWAKAYKIDAFRFDLMGHHMKRNMEKVRDTLAALTLANDGVDGSQIYVYGEGWNFGEVMNNTRGVNATQLNLADTGIGTFSDRLRDAVRGGSPFDSGEDLLLNQGYVSGLYYEPNSVNSGAAAELTRLLLLADHIKVGLAGNLKNFRLVARTGNANTGASIGYNGQPTGYTTDPQEQIVYVSKHDNQTLFDINAYKAKAGISSADRVRIHGVAQAMTLLSQGVPFIHAGDDLLRSKSMERDSYDSGDWWNRIDWTGQDNNWNVGLPREDKDGPNWSIIQQICMDTTAAPSPADIQAASDRFQELLALRFSSPLFRLRTEAQVMSRVDFHNNGPSQIPGLIAMSITDGTCAGTDLDPNFEAVMVLFNANDEAQTLSVAGASGFVLHPLLVSSTDTVVQTASFSGDTFSVPARTTAVFVKTQAGAQSDAFPCNTR